MNIIRLNSSADVPYYLDQLVIEQFSDLIIESENGEKFRFNHLLLIMKSSMAKDILKEAFAQDSTNLAISTNFSQSELKIFYDFIMRGILPCPETDIMNGKISSDLNNIFLSFGVDLKSTLFSRFIKKEKTEDEIVIEPDTFMSDYYSKRELSDYDDDNFFGDHDIKDIINPGEEYKYMGHLNTPEIFGVKKTGKKRKGSKGDMDYEPFMKKAKVKKDKYLSPKTIKRTIKREKVEGEEIMDVIEKSVFNRRGIRKKIKENLQFSNHKMMLEYQERFKNSFKIQIAPPDFTQADFDKFDFPKPIEQLEVIPPHLSDKPSKITLNQTYPSKCLVCKLKCNSASELKDHYVKTHTIHYPCPIENCNFVIQKFNDTLTLFKFARHIHFHSNKHPQYAHPHECIACGYTTPYIQVVEQHLKSMGPYHNNKCPKCSSRFYSREDLVEHMKIENHESYCCGLCEEVLDTKKLKIDHQRTNHGMRPIKQAKKVNIEFMSNYFFSKKKESTCVMSFNVIS